MTTTPQQHLDQLNQSLRTTHPVPALALAVVHGFGQHQVGSAQGVRRRNLAAGAPGNAVLASDRFWVGSISKPMTGFLMARLDQSGAMKWNTRIRDVFPEFADAGCRARLGIRADYLDVTVEQLMSHGSGLFDQYAAAQPIARSNPPGSPDDWWQFDPGSMRTEWSNLSATAYRRLAMTILSLREPPLFPPGSKAGYGPAPTLAAAMAERRTGQRFEDMLYAQRVLQPAEMTQSGWGGFPTQTNPPTNAFMHLPDGTPDDRFQVSSWCGNAATGTMMCSARDLCRFMVQNMPARAGTPARLLGDPQIAAMHGLLPNGGTRGGWGRSSASGGYTVQHNGANGSMYAEMMIHPNAGWGVAASVTIGGPVSGQIVTAAMEALKKMQRDWTALFGA